jgi:hypothetical protein
VPLPAAWAACTSLVLVAAGIAGYYGLRATSWSVMTDELQVVRLAESIAERLLPVPVIHGVYYGALSQLYPLLLAPLFGLLSPPAAQTAAHALNAVLLPSAAWPAYLLARSVTESRSASLAAAALTAFTPWLVLTATLLTENVAYPAFVWAMYLCHRALAKPSVGGDALALAGLALAFFARTQLVVLAVVLPLALLVHAGPKRAVKGHPQLVCAYSAALTIAALLFFAGSLGSVVGNYAVSFDGDVLPRGLWEATASHLVHVVVGAGVVPFVFATAYVLLTLPRRDRGPAHAFAALFAVCVPLLSLEVASFDLRFTAHAFGQDRYLFYVTPLFAVGMAAAMVSRAAMRRFALLVLAAFALVTWLVLEFGDYRDRTVIFWASPAAAVHTVFPNDAVLVAVAALLVLAALLMLWRVPRFALPVAAVVLSLTGAAQAIYVFERYVEPALTRPPAMKLARNWIDRRVPGGASVALVPAPRDTAAYWWEAELWNKQVERVLRVNNGPVFSPFPTDDLTLDLRRGLLRGPQPSAYLALSGSEKRFHLVEQRALGGSAALKLVRVRRPYRLDWATRDITPDGWTVAGRAATIRVYGSAGNVRRRVVIVLAASKRAALPLDFTLRGGGQVRSGSVDPGGARPPVRLDVCVPRNGFVDLRLTSHGAVRIPDGRLVAVHLDRVAVTTAKQRC